MRDGRCGLRADAGWKKGLRAAGSARIHPKLKVLKKNLTETDSMADIWRCPLCQMLLFQDAFDNHLSNIHAISSEEGRILIMRTATKETAEPISFSSYLTSITCEPDGPKEESVKSAR